MSARRAPGTGSSARAGGLVPVLVRVPEEPHAVDAVPQDVERLVGETFAVQVERIVARLLVRAREVPRVRGRIGGDLLRARNLGPDAVHPSLEGRIGLDVPGGRPVPLAARREHEVVALAPDRHRRASDDAVRPRQPRHDQHRRRSGRCGGASQPLARVPLRTSAASTRSAGANTKTARTSESAAASAPAPSHRGQLGSLPRTREHVEQGERDRSCERLAQDECDVVLRPRIDGVEQAAEQRDALAPPAANGEHQEVRADPEEQGLADQRRRVVAAEDLVLAEEREVRGVARRAEHLPLRLVPGRLGDACPGDVEPAVRVDEVEAGLERRRVAAVEERVRGRDVRPRVRLLVRVQERDVDEAVQRGQGGEEQRAAPEGRSRQPHACGL